MPEAYTFFTECGAEVYVDENGDEWDIEYEDVEEEWGEWESCCDDDEEDPDFEYEYTYWDEDETNTQTLSSKL